MIWRFVLGFALLCVAVEAQTNINSFELSDQNGRLHKVSFPREKSVVVTIADQKGAVGMDSWIAALKTRYGTNVSYIGIANVSSTPAAMRPFVKARFKQKYRYPVLLDWQGEVLKQFSPAKGVPNVYLVAADGQLIASAKGGCDESSLTKFPIDPTNKKSLRMEALSKAEN